MSLFGRLALFFIAVPIVELALLIRIGQWIGVWPTVGLVFLTGVSGAMLARAEGLRTLWTFQNELAQGRLPGRAILDGVSILVGGALLLTPGFATDLVGFALLLPLTRRWIHRRAKRRLESMIDEGTVRVVGIPGGLGGVRGGAFGEEFGGGPAEDDADESAASGTRALDPDKEISQ